MEFTSITVLESDFESAEIRRKFLSDSRIPTAIAAGSMLIYVFR